MNNAISMSAEFERQKNIRAAALTAVITGLVLLLIILVKLTNPIKIEPPVDDFVEIEMPNLGNSDVGFGNDQPQLPGEPAAAQQVSYSPPQQVQADEAAKDVANDDEKSNDAPPVIKPTVSRPDATKTNAETKTVKTNNTVPTTAPPTPPKPKATLGRTVGGNGNGGNGAETYKPGSGEGTGGRPGQDQGVVGGDPNGKVYTGTPRNIGVREFPIGNQSFEDDFNQNAKIAMSITTDANGKVTSATYTAKHSTGTATAAMIEIARRRAFQLKLGNDAMKGIVIFNFKVK